MRCAGCGESTLRNPCGSCGADPLFDGRFKLLEVLGEGANGVTWRARCMATGAEVALKEVVLSGDPKADELWAREASVLQQLDHPGIPRCVEAFEHRQGRVRTGVLVLSLVDGQSLATELKMRRHSEADVLEVARGLLPILAYLHGLSPPVVHRDLKPSNVVRRPNGDLALVDFGSVRDSLPGAFGGSTVAGTFGFMAPEQFRGEACPATDLYGLGVLLVTLLTRDDPRTLLDAHGQLDWRGRVRVSPATLRLLEALLQVDPDARPPDAQAATALLPGPLAEPLENQTRRVFGGLIAAGVVSGAVTGAMAAVLLAPPAEERVVARVERPVAVTVPVITAGPAIGATRRELVVGAAYLWNASPLEVTVGLDGAYQSVASGAVERVPWDVEGGWLTWRGERSLELAAGSLARFDGQRWEQVAWSLADAPLPSVVAAWPAGDAQAPMGCTASLVYAAEQVVDIDVSACPPGLADTGRLALADQVMPPSEGPVRTDVGLRVDPGVRRRTVVVAAGGSADELVVDGWSAGSLPWTGTLAPGRHNLVAGARTVVVDVQPGEGAQLIRLGL